MNSRVKKLNKIPLFRINTCETINFRLGTRNNKIVEQKCPWMRRMQRVTVSMHNRKAYQTQVHDKVYHKEIDISVYVLLSSVRTNF